MDYCSDEGPIVNQPQSSPVPVSTDDIRDLYNTQTHYNLRSRKHDKSNGHVQVCTFV